MKDRLENIQTSTLGLGITTDLTFFGDPNEVLKPIPDLPPKIVPKIQKSKHQLPTQARNSWEGPYES